MMLYAIKVEKCKYVDEWLRATRIRGAESSMLKNPFKWKIRRVKDIIIFDVSVLYPNFTWFGWMMAVGIWYIWGWKFWIIPALMLGCLGIFWRPEFMYWMTKKGLRKAGYKGPIKRLRMSALIREVIL